ncbi:MAG: hypothetical protein ABJF28_00110, partial [Nisaea sp.]
DLAAFQITAEAYLEDVSSLLNTQLAGRYLFAGSNTQESPVDLTAYEAIDLTTTDSSYYTGDTYVQTVRLSSERSIDYGITADTEAIEMTMRALSYAASADPLTTDDVEALSDLLVEAQDGVIALQSITSTTASSLESFISSEGEYIAEAEELASELNTADVAELIVQASSYEVQLEASYVALGSISDLSVLDYLF